MHSNPLTSIRKSVNTSNVLKYRFGYIRNGKRHLVTPWVSNMLTDAGLDKVATQPWTFMLQYMLLGTAVSPTPVRRDGGATTFTQSGNTLTASGNFFEAADVGRLFKYGTGTAGVEMYITGFTSQTDVTVGVSATVSTPTVGTIWYVNTAALTTFLQASASNATGGSDNNTTQSGGVVTHKRTCLGSALGAPATITEIAFNDSGSNSNVFDRDVIAGGVSLLAGDIPLAVVNLIQTYSPVTSRAVGNVGTVGIDTTGNLQLEYIQQDGGQTGSYIRSDGACMNNGGGFLEPSNVVSINAITANFTLQALSNSSAPSYTGSGGSSSNGSYSNGSFTLDRTTDFSIFQANGTIYGFCLGNNRILTQKFTTPPTKTSSDIMQFVLTFTWQRVLTN